MIETNKQTTTAPTFTEQMTNIKTAAKINSEIITNLDLSNSQLINQLTTLVQQGLTTYKSPDNFEDARQDLIRHIQGQQIEVIFNEADNPIAFGVYAIDLTKTYFEIARIVHPNYQDKKLGKYLVLSGCNYNSDLEYLVSSTQNQRAFFSIQSALTEDNIISPNLQGGDFQYLNQKNQEIVKKVAKLRNTEYTTNNGTLPSYYKQTNGLYGQNINQTETFPINTDNNADAILIVAKNPFYKSQN